MKKLTLLISLFCFFQLNTVNAQCNFNFSYIISFDQSKCPGTTISQVNFFAPPSGGTYTLQWYYKNTVADACPNGITSTSGWTLIPGATATSYAPGPAVQSRTYACFVTPTNSPGCVPKFTTGCARVTVYDTLQFYYGRVDTTTWRMCPGGDVLPFGFDSMPIFEGNSAGTNFQWYYKDSLVAAPSGSSTAGWTLINGATDDIYNPPAGLSVNRTYACTVRDIYGCKTIWAQGVKKIKMVMPSAVDLGTALVNPRDTFCNSDVLPQLQLVSNPSGASFFSYYIYNSDFACNNLGLNTSALDVTSIGPITTALQNGILRISSAGCGSVEYCFNRLRVQESIQYPFYNSQWLSETSADSVYYLNFCTDDNESTLIGRVPTNTFNNPERILHYQWYYKTGFINAPTGSSTTGWTLIPGATHYLYTAPTGMPERTYACYTTSDVIENCPIATGWQAGAYWIGNGNSFSNGTIAAGDQTICYGETINPVTFSSVPAGYPITPSGPGTSNPLQDADYATKVVWYKYDGIAGCPTGSQIPASWTNFLGTTDAEITLDLNTPASVGAFSSSITIAAYVTPPDKSCPSAWASNCRKITINNPINYGTLAGSGSQSICSGGDPSPITFATLPSGGTGNFTYQWYYIQGTNVDCQTYNIGNGYVLIPGATGTTYNPPPGITSTRTYNCLVTPVGTCDQRKFVDCHIVAVNSAFNPGQFKNGSPATVSRYVCANTIPPTFEMWQAPSGGDGQFTYQWYYREGVSAVPTGGTAGWTIMPGFTNVNLTLTAPIPNTRSFGCFVTPVNPSSCGLTSTGSWANGVHVMHLATSINYGVIDTLSQNICPGGIPSTIGFYTLPSIPGSTTSSIWSYQWYYKDGIVAAPTGTSTVGWTMLPNNTGVSLLLPDAVNAPRTFACFVSINNAQLQTGCVGQWATGRHVITTSGTNGFTSFGSLEQLDDVICSGSIPSYIGISSLPVNPTNPIRYDWYIKEGTVADPTGTSTTGWTLMASNTAPPYVFTLPMYSTYTVACYVSPQASSVCGLGNWMGGSRHITVLPALDPGRVTAGDVAYRDFCNSDNIAPISFAQLPTGGSGHYKYLWSYATLNSNANYSTTDYSNLTYSNPVTNTSSSTFIPDNVSASRVFKCVVKDSIESPCNLSGEAIGYFILRFVTDTLSTVQLPKILNADESICSGGNPSHINFETPSLIDLNYQWYYQDGNATCPSGSNTTGWTVINTPDATFNAYDPPAGLSNNRTYACLISSTQCNAPSWAQSCRKITVANASNVNYGTLAQGNCGYCATNANPGVINFSTLPVGGVSYAYQWYYRDGIIAAPTGNSTTGWTIISGATLSSYDPGAGVNASRTYACFVTPTGPVGCPTIAGAWANGCRQVTVTTTTPQVNYGTITTYHEYVCQPQTNVTLSFTTPPAGATNTFTYQWYNILGDVACPSGSSTTGWTPVSTSQSITGIIAGYTYACFVTPGTNGNCQTSGAWATGCYFTGNISSAALSGTIAPGDQVLCSYEIPNPISFSSLPANSPNCTYQWYFKTSLVAAPTGSSTSGWTFFAEGNYPTINPPAVTSDRTYACMVRTYQADNTCYGDYWANGCRQIDNVNPASVNYGTVTSGTATICAGGDPGPITFSTLPANFPAGYTLQWYKSVSASNCPAQSSTTDGWQLIPGATSATYDPPANMIFNATRIACRVIPNVPSGCFLSSSITPRFATNCYTISITPDITYSYGSITNTIQSLCVGSDPLPFSLTPGSGSGFTYSYQWYSRPYAEGNTVNNGSPEGTGWTLIPGATGTSYDPQGPATQSLYYMCYVIATPPANTCNNGTRRVMLLAGAVVLGNFNTFSLGTIASANQTICEGTTPSSISFSSPSNGTGYTFTYQWYYADGVGICPSGNSTVGWTSIAGATTATYTPPALNTSRTFACMVTATDGAGCNNVTVGWATNCRQVTVYPTNALSFGTLSAGATSVCSGGNPYNLAFSTPPTSGLTVTYSWYYQDGIISCPTGNSTTGWTLISTGSTATYNTPAITASRSYACLVTFTTSGCGSVSGWATNCMQVSVNDNIALGTIAAGDQNICLNGDPSLITFSTGPVGGSGTYTYQWYYQDGNITCPTGSSTIGWTSISGATSATYDPPSALMVNRTYACKVTTAAQGGNCPVQTGWATNCRHVSMVQNITTGTVTPSTENVCRNGDPQTVLQLSSLPTGGVFTYQWGIKQTCNSSSQSNIAGATSTTYDIPAPFSNLSATFYSCNITIAATDLCPSTTFFADGCATVTPTELLGGTFSPSFVGNGESICAGGDPSIITVQVTPNSTTSYQYKWYYRDGEYLSPAYDTDSLAWTYITTTVSPNLSYNPPAGLANTRTYAVYSQTIGTGLCQGVISQGWLSNVVVFNVTSGVAFNTGALSQNNQSLCSGGDPSAITFATPPSGGTGYTYQWYYQDGLITCPSGSSTVGWTLINGATNNNYDPPSGLIANRTYACMVSSSGQVSCGTNSGWASNCRQITINPAATFGTLATGNETICSGGNPAAIAFATTPAGGSGTYTYQWYYQDGLITCPTGSSTSGWTIISGATTSSYDPPTGLAVNRTYACLVTATVGNGCTASTGWAAQCRQVTVTTNPSINYGTLTTGNESFCTTGDPSNITFATTPSGGGTFTYQWYYQNELITCPIGTSTSGWTIISGATASNYDAPSGLTQSRTYACMVTVSGACVSGNQWAANCRQVTITIPPTVTYGTLTTGNESFCTTGDPGNITFATVPSGGTFTYQWYYQDGIITCPSGTSTAGWTIISGATAANYDAPSGLIQSRTYACMVTVTGACVSGNSWASNCRQVTITPAATFGTLSTGNESFCGTGDPSNITFATTPSGGSNNFTYQWYYQDGLISCPTGSSTAGWTIVSGATTSGYNPPSGLVANRTYACLVTAAAGNGCTATTIWAAQCRQVTVTPTATFGTLALNNESICTGGDPAAIPFATTPSGGSGNYTYQWYYQDGLITCPSGSSTAGWTIISGATTSSYDPPTGLTQNRTYACMVTATAGSGCTATTGWATQCRQVTITTNPIINYGTLTSANEAFCNTGDPTNITFATAPSGGGGTFTYQWYYQDGLVACPTGTSTAGWTIISGATASNYDAPSGLTQSRTYACFVTLASACASGSSWATQCRQVTISILPPVNYGTLVTVTETFCTTGDPANIVFSTTPSGGSGTQTYQWYYQDGLITCPIGSSTAGWTVISGATTSSYDPTSITASRTYACLVTDAGNGTCLATSNWATNCRQVTVNTVAYGTIANGAETICINGDPAPISFGTLPTGGGAITYQWYYRNGTQVCPTGTSTFGMVLITGATSATYDPPSGLNQTRTYACMVNIAAGNGCPAGNSWATNCRIVTVTPLPNYGTLYPNTKRICKGGNPDPLVFQTLPSGGTTYTYQWYYKNGSSLICPSGTNTSGWTLIPGGTAQNYDPPAGLTLTRTYACMVTSSGNGTCSNGTRWATNCVVQTVVPPPTYGTLANGNESVCSGGNPAAISFSTVPGGYGTKTYQWYYKDGVSGSCPTGSSTTGWTSIPGATIQSYDPPNGLTTSRTYACMVTASGTPCAGGQWATNCRKVTIITCREVDYIGFDNDLPEDGKGDADNTTRPQLDGPVLEQNIPNPFTETTSITCTLPKAYNSAVIRVVNVLGEELLLKKLSSPGVNKIEVNRGTLTPGIYFYSLYLDGKLYDTKRMVVTY